MLRFGAVCLTRHHAAGQNRTVFTLLLILHQGYQLHYRSVIYPLGGPDGNYADLTILTCMDLDDLC